MRRFLNKLKIFTPRYVVGDYASYEDALRASRPPSVENQIKTQEMARIATNPGLTVASVMAGGALTLTKEHINVLDFGGGLGVAYLKSRVFEGSGLNTWYVVDKPEIIEYGQKYYQHEELLFRTFDQVPPNVEFNLLILAGVLNYLENPIATLHDLLTVFDPDVVVIDRTAVGLRQRHRIQNFFSGGSVPFTILSEEDLTRSLISYDTDACLELKQDLWTGDDVYASMVLSK